MFVTVLANLRMSFRFPLSSHKSPAYISRILAPSCFFVSVLGFPGPAPFISPVGLRGIPGVLDRLMAERGLGVRGNDPGVAWKAYVMDKASERWTSALKLHLTRLSKDAMKCGNTSSSMTSAFNASRSLLMTPALG